MVSGPHLYRFCCVTWDKLFNLSVLYPQNQDTNSSIVGVLYESVYLQHLDQCLVQRKSFELHTHTHTRTPPHTHTHSNPPANLGFHFVWCMRSLSIFHDFIAVSSLLLFLLSLSMWGLVFFFFFAVPLVRFGQTVEFFPTLNHKSPQLSFSVPPNDPVQVVYSSYSSLNSLECCRHSLGSECSGFSGLKPALNVNLESGWEVPQDEPAGWAFWNLNHHHWLRGRKGSWHGGPPPSLCKNLVIHGCVRTKQQASHPCSLELLIPRDHLPRELNHPQSGRRGYLCQ